MMYFATYNCSGFTDDKIDYINYLLSDIHVLFLQEFSACVIHTSIRSCIIIFGTNLPVDFLSLFVVCTYIYIYICLCFLCIAICMHSFHSAHIFKVCNSVI